MSKFWQKKYISKYTGEEIDAAVAKADTVPAVTATDAGKALVVDEEGKIVAGEAGGAGNFVVNANLDAALSGTSLVVDFSVPFESEAAFTAFISEMSDAIEKGACVKFLSEVKTSTGGAALVLPVGSKIIIDGITCLTTTTPASITGKYIPTALLAYMGSGIQTADLYYDEVNGITGTLSITIG